MRWVDKYNSTNKISDSHITFIKQQLKQNKTIIMEELLTKLKTKFSNLTLSRVHLGRLDEIPIHIYKNEKYVKKHSTRKLKPKKYMD